tara:strand:- start:1730 stop:3121 length:1392 start_codon:yes stop_codon:yes gene_type:complete
MEKNKSFQERELEILRNAVDKASEQTAAKLIKTPTIKEIINIVETFLKRKKLVCYGGTAINNILPEQDKFYNKNLEIPDYDFFSPNALKDAKELADIYYKAGYEEVEAKSGIHGGTFKVFVNYIPVADITFLNSNIYKNLFKESIKINNIYYCPPNYLRMSMYLELSRPEGDITRWEKILKRLILLNKNYPLRGFSCNSQNFMRDFEGSNNDRDNIYDIAKNSFIDQGLIFFGGYASTLYGKYMPKHQRKVLNTIPDFDLLAEDPLMAATITRERLLRNDYKNVKVVFHNKIGEVIPVHYEIIVNGDTIAFIYNTNACHSYNTLYLNGRIIKIASIDTMLSFYLAFLYANKPYYDKNRLLCMSEYLFKVQARNRLQQKGLLNRFSIKCYGKQKTLEDIRGEKTEKYKQLKNKKNSLEFEKYFLRYIPESLNKSKKYNNKCLKKYNTSKKLNKKKNRVYNKKYK